MNTPTSNSSPAWSLVLGCLEEFPKPAPFSFVPQLPHKTANLGRLQRMGFRSAKLGSSVQSSLQPRWKNPRSLILVNSLVVVFKSPCPDFQNLVPAPKPVVKIFVASCRARMPQLVLNHCCLVRRDNRSHTNFMHKNAVAATRLSH